MSPYVLLSFVVGYFLLLLAVAWYTSKNSDNESFFNGNKNSNWMLVAFGMIGTSLSGVTFVSVPGGVGKDFFAYFQLVIGYFFGYLVVAYVLLPLYYKMNLTSIYTYLEKRIGVSAHKAGAFFFILSRTVGATARLYLVVNILQIFIFDNLFSQGSGIPFWLTTLVILIMILLYTLEGGVKTIVYTDTLQTSGMLIGLVACIYFISQAMNSDFSGVFQMMKEKNYTQVFNFDVKSGGNFFKQFLGGMFITITMTGLDQEMMQKNISVKTLGSSQKNMMTLSTILLVVNFLFLFLGGVLHVYASANNITATGDDLFPTIALGSVFASTIGIVFIIALISALFPSVDGAITSLTSCFCIDILGFNKLTISEAAKKKKRLAVHLTFAVVFFLLVLIFKAINDKSIIQFILKFAGITYGPLLGLFAFGILTKKRINPKLVWPICIAGPVLTLIIDMLCNPGYYESKLHVQLGLNQISESIFAGYKIGPELILINGAIVFLGLLIFSKKNEEISIA
jgi:Na+/proline symporter